MNASSMRESTSTVVRPNKPSDTQTLRAVPYYRTQQLGKQEADRAFEAGVKWFLEVSRKA